MAESTNNNHWEKCRTCGKSIPFRARYYTCSVSSCNRKSNPIVFCSVNCWDIHAPVMNHKNAGADENYAPSAPHHSLPSSEQTPRRVLIKSPSSSSHQAENDLLSTTNKDILIVVSKCKSYIKDRSDLQTSADVMDALSDIVRSLCDEAIVKAKKEGRKTVMARDF